LLTLGLTVGAKDLDWGVPPEIVPAENGDWGKPAEPTAEQIRQAAVWADAEKDRQAEVAKAVAKPKPKFEGITALFLREGEGEKEKSIIFKTRIQSTNEFKSTSHYPGVVVRALSPQGSKRPDNRDFRVATGNNLEILRLHSGNDYHVYNFSKKRRGIVKISFVEMMDNPEVISTHGPSWMNDTTIIAA
jgi:hypothetical protein